MIIDIKNDMLEMQTKKPLKHITRRVAYPGDMID